MRVPHSLSDSPPANMTSITNTVEPPTMQWIDIVKRYLSISKSASLTITLSAGVRMDGGPVACYVVRKKSDHRYEGGFVTMTQREADWFIKNVSDTYEGTCEQTNYNQEVVRILRVKPLLTKHLLIEGKRGDKPWTRVQVPSTELENFVRLLKESAQRFKAWSESKEYTIVRDKLQAAWDAYEKEKTAKLEEQLNEEEFD